ncbi:hypothetical protein HT746_06165 [Burkholderia pyrrocinia]|uniref:hypothetical protein n=1 Tax=Burkholderia pyrrocinia TaxID=60550 RepID=UPI001577772D|nr:hypothetical protein [Burkholderia pyrrocinia]NTX26725.1 hypothetical protein [Burkholderia pyrrocinia]
MSVQAKLLSLYDRFPFHQHPVWSAVLSGRFSQKQIAAAEIQHCIRTAAGQKLRATAVSEAQSISPTIFAAVLDTYLEECTAHDGMPSHLDMIKALVFAAGATDAEIQNTLVYDPDHNIRNPSGLERDLCRKDRPLTVHVVVVPK